MKATRASIAITILVTVGVAGWISAVAKPAGRIFAQQLVERALATHPEVTGVELSSTPAGKLCVAIASTDPKDLGDKCDTDELTPMKTNEPFVEKEKEGGKDVYDITMPLHDTGGNVIGAVGMDFKPEPGQKESQVVKAAQRIVGEMETQIPAKAKLFETAK
jgi:hypothetical protein